MRCRFTSTFSSCGPARKWPSSTLDLARCRIPTWAGWGKALSRSASRRRQTAAFLSHAHVDHINGFVKDNKPVFTNAALHALQAEVDFWRSPEPDFSKSKRDKKPLPNMIKNARDKFDVLQPNLQLLKGGEVLLNGAVTVEAAPGHTDGHLICRVQSGQDSLLHFMDVAHHHTLMFTNSDWGVAFDHDPDQARDTRKKVFSNLAATHERAYGFHLPWPRLGRVVTRGAGYGWEAERWSWGV